MAELSVDDINRRAPRIGRETLADLLRHPGSGAAVGLVVMFAVFSVVAGPRFLTAQSFAAMALLTAELGIIALGVALLLTAGEFDLSVGSVLGFASALVPWLALRGWPVAAAILMALFVALLMGVLNGLIVTRFGLPSLVITLGALFWWRGILFAITGGFPIPVDRSDPAFLPLTASLGGGFNMSIVWLACLAGILSVLLLRTQFGNWILATGGNERAAQQVGIPTRRLKVMLFGLASLLAALAGIIQASRFAAVDALRGTTVELEAVAAVVIGGTRLMGGHGTVVGTIFGVMMLAVIRNGLVLAGIASFWYRALLGLLIITAVVVNQRIGGQRIPG